MKSASGRSADYANVLQTLIRSVRLLQEATESTSLPVPSGPLAGVAIDRLETIKTLKANKDVGEELAEKIVHQVGTIYHELARPATNESDAPRLTRGSVSRYTKALTDAQDTLIRLSQRGRLGQSLLRGRDRRELLSVMSAVDTEFTSFMETLGREQNPAREFRRSLHITPAALQDFGFQGISASGRPSSPLSANEVSILGQQQQQQSYCWPGTRIPILDEIDHWATATTSHITPGSSTNPSLVYWLADIPGSGKSAIAASLVEEWKAKGILGGYYNFELSNAIHVPGESGEGLVPGVGDITDALCEAWATQLGAAYPELSAPILRALSDIHRSPSSSSLRTFSNQLKQLIVNPLKSLQRAHYDLQPHSKIIFVLDSIDECPSVHRAAVLQGIKGVNAAHGGVKFFLISSLPTSEDDNDIAVELLGSPASLVTRGSINIHSASNMADILLYLTSQFQVHAAQFSNHSQFRTALIEPTIRVLAKRAEGLILWARVAFEMLLMAENPTRVLLNLVEEDALLDVRGLYLELMLTAQSNLDVLNELRASLAVPKEERGSRPEEPSAGFSIVAGPPKVPEAFPRNALALVVSAVGYATEPLSVTAIAEFTGLGVERTVVILDLLSTVIDSLNSSLPRRSTSQPHVALASSSRVNLATSIAPGMVGPPPKPRKRSSSAPRKSSFSPPRKKSRPLSSHGIPKFPQTPISGNFSMAPNSPRRPSDSASHNNQGFNPSNRNLLSPSAGNIAPLPFPSVAHSGYAAGGTVRIRHATFREWIRLPHPPTLLSCLTGKGTAEEDDLRFLLAPSSEGAHAMLAKGCFGIIRSTTLTPEQVEDRDRDLTTEGCSEDGFRRGKDGGDLFEDEMVSYACRYWAHHCAGMLSSLTGTHKRSSIYMAISSNIGMRWKAIRGEMLEFFTRKLLWWVDASIALNCAAHGSRGLRALQEVLMGMDPEEDVKSAVDQLIHWTTEALQLLDNPLEFAEDEHKRDSSLVFQYYGEELTLRAAFAEMQRAELAEIRRAELAERENARLAELAELERVRLAELAELEKTRRAELVELEKVRLAEVAEREKARRALPSPAAAKTSLPTLSSPDYGPGTVHAKTTSSGHSAPREVSDSVGKSGSTFTGTTSVSTGEVGKEEGHSGDLNVLESLKDHKGLPQTPMARGPSSEPRPKVPEQSRSRAATNGSTTPTALTAQPPLAETENPSLLPNVAVDTKRVFPPSSNARHPSLPSSNENQAEPKDEPTIRPPQKTDVSSPRVNRTYSTAAPTKLFPGLAFFQNSSQQSLISPVSPSSDPSKRKHSSPSSEALRHKESFPVFNVGAAAASTSLPSPVSPHDHAKHQEPSKRESSAATSTKSSAGAATASVPPPIPSSSEQPKRPDPSNRKISSAASTKSTGAPAAPTRTIPPPAPRPIVTSSNSSGPPRTSTGELGPELGDILNMINFDNLTPSSLSPGSSGATRATGVN